MNKFSLIVCLCRNNTSEILYVISDEEETMSQENIDHDSKRKTDSKTCMPDVEEVSCETCFELIGKVTGDC